MRTRRVRLGMVPDVPCVCAVYFALERLRHVTGQEHRPDPYALFLPQWVG
jgi:hypothetical protein